MKLSTLKKITAWIQFVVITLLMISLWFIQITQGDKLSTENRILSASPQLFLDLNSRKAATMEALYGFGEQTDGYFNDRFPLRNKILERFRLTQIQVNGGASPADNVILGKNGFYFHNAPQHIEYIENDLYSSEELENVVQTFVKRDQFTKEHGKQYYVIISAVKSDVYPENLPESWPKFTRETTPKTRGDQVYMALQQAGIMVYYTLPNLLELKQEREVFYPFDTHWNPYGASMSYQQMWTQFDPTIQLPQLGKEYTIVNDPNWKSDLQKMMGTTLIPEVGYKYEFTNLQGTQTQPMHVIQPNPNKKYFTEHRAFYNQTKTNDALVFHTSYHIQLEPLYQETFREVQMYKLVTDYSKKLVEESNAEIVVQEMGTVDFNNEPIDFID